MMDKETVLSSLIRIISEVFSVNAGDLGGVVKQSDIKNWDSLGQIRLIMAIEQHFKVKFGIEEVMALNDSDKITKAIMEKLI